MRLNDAPEHECPDCEDQPTLVYEDSVGPAGIIGSSGRVENGTTIHFYRCASCGGRYRAHDAVQVIRSESNAQRIAPSKKCFNCGGTMRVRKVATDTVPPSSGPRTFGGSYNRVETMMAWKCENCGTTDDFKHSEVLGFN